MRFCLTGILLVMALFSCQKEGGETNAKVKENEGDKNKNEQVVNTKMEQNNHPFTEAYHTQQIVLVTSPSESSITGSLRILNYEADKKTWVSVSAAVPVTLGRTGIAWGKGMHPSEWNQGTMKKEGDGKSPQGIFNIIRLFGNVAKESLSFKTALPYLHISGNEWVCVDDVNSEYYNRIVSEKKVVKDWNSAEQMLRTDGLYELGAILDYNLNPVVKGEGSCVFMHIWRASDKPTAGCTATQKAELSKIFSTLDAERHPVLVQMTEANARKHLSGLGVEI
ncbi:MAG: hypothetical protein K1X92_12120 [Bacteroidia bacterium]|nr:hypothetical protein [Bacteroidia bacterium]